MKFRSLIYSTVSGSVGGLTYADGRYGMYVRARATPVDPQSGLQSVVRNAFASLVSRWSNTLTAVQRDAWDLYADNVPVPGTFGDPQFMTGFNQYVRSNTPRIQAALPVVDDGPVIFSYPAPGPSVLYGADATTDEIGVTLDAGDTWMAEDDAGLLVYQGRPQTATRNFYKGPYRFVDSIDGDSATPPSGTVDLAAAYPFEVGDAIFGYVRLSLADGRLSTKWTFRTFGT